MKKILMMLMLLVSTKVLAVDWVKVSESADGSFTGYVDPQSIRRIGNKVRAWTLKDLKSDKKVVGSTRFLSMATRNEYDCFEDTHRTIDIYEYSAKMGTGDIVSSIPNITDPAISVPPGSFFAAELKLVCATK